MGVKGLYSYLRPYRKSPHLEETFCIGIDVLSLLYKFRGNLEKIESLLNQYMEKGFTFVAVFDGKSPEAKQEEVNERRKKREDAQKQMGELKKYLTSQDSSHLDEKARGLLEKKVHELEMGEAWYVTRTLLQNFKELLRRKDIQIYKAKEEADDILMSLFTNGKIRCVLSTDMDFLVMGVERLWIPAETMEEIQLQEVLSSEDVTIKQLQEIAILCRDNTPTGKAFSWMRYYGSIEPLQTRNPSLLIQYTKEQLECLRSSFTISKSLEDLLDTTPN
jgi:5'-3' exonuclease